MSTTTENQLTKPRQFTGKHMLLIMCCFFGVIIVVNFTMAYIASQTWTGLVVKNSYVASQHYNEKLDDAERQRALGLYSDASYENSVFHFTLRNKEKEALLLKDVSIKLGRPAFEQEDKVLTFDSLRTDTLSIPLELEKGAWALEINAKTASKTYRRDLRLFINDKKQGLIE